MKDDGWGESIWDVFPHTCEKFKWGDNGDAATDAYYRRRDDVAIM
jgi:beta-glucosidase/6-phospho-beta-glucosidase/beta-galactosidase